MPGDSVSILHGESGRTTKRDRKSRQKGLGKMARRQDVLTFLNKQSAPLSAATTATLSSRAISRAYCLWAHCLLKRMKTLWNTLASILSVTESQEAKRGTGKINHYLWSAKPNVRKHSMTCLWWEGQLLALWGWAGAFPSCQEEQRDKHSKVVIAV